MLHFIHLTLESRAGADRRGKYETFRSVVLRDEVKRDLAGPKECSRDAGNNSNRILEVGHSRGWHWALKKTMGAGLMDYRWGRREVLLGARWQRVHQQMDTWVVSRVQWIFFFLIKKKPWCYHATMFLLVLTHALFKCYLGISNKWNIQTKNKSGNCNCTWLCRGHTFPSSKESSVKSKQTNQTPLKVAGHDSECIGEIPS